MKPQVIVIRGPLGVGKSSISHMLLDKLKNKIKRLAYIPIDVSIYPFMKNYFQLSRKERMEIMQENLESILNNFLKRKFTVIVEGIFSADHLERVFRIARKSGTEVKVIELHASLDTLHKRVKARKKENPYAWENPVETEKKYKKFMKSLHDRAIIIDTDGKTPENITKEILERLR